MTPITFQEYLLVATQQHVPRSRALQVYKTCSGDAHRALQALMEIDETEHPEDWED